MKSVYTAIPITDADGAAGRTPVALPRVDISVDEDGAAIVTLDGTPYEPGGAIGRSGVDGVLQDIAARHGPVRACVTESDGATYTDVVVPASHGVPSTEDAAEPASGLDGRGFRPEEAVDVAIVVAHQQADADGTARLRLPSALLATHRHSIVLLDRASGRYTVCEAP